jgi:DNA-binding SARP family transcriptional activator/WD40 repeat protein
LTGGAEGRILDRVPVRIRVLGSCQIDGHDRLGRRDRVVLAALVVAGRVAMPADRLAEALYGDAPAPTWRKTVQGSVARLRRVLGPRAIETVADGYRLTVGDDDIDARRFERLYQRAVELMGVGQAARAVPMLQDGLGLFHGEPLADLDGWGPGRDEAGRVHELRRQAEERLVEALLAEGRLDEAVTSAVSLASREPLREQRWVALARAFYRSDRQADALRAIDHARRLLREELGVDPGPALTAVEQAVLAHDPTLRPRTVPARAGATSCPYKGLAAYDVDDADAFFGRDHEIEACVTRLLQTGVLAIVGPSGSGKSSLARAGVVPVMRRRGQPVVVITPGPDPVARLAHVAPGTAVVVDQLEELFTTSTDAAAAQEFGEALVRRAVQAPIVLILRADFVASVSTVAPLASLVQSGLHLLAPMSEAQLRAAIEEPAQRAGLRLEPGLVDLLVRDVEGQSGALPLLSHALAETWARRDDRVLTVEGYRAGGGVQGAVAATADRVVDRLPPEGRRITRSLLLRLVSLTDTGAPVRYRLPWSDLVHDHRQTQVVDALLAARLLTADADGVEVTHEALGRAWPRLRAWLDEDREGQRILLHLSAATAEWERIGRDPAELYRGARLRTAEEWVAATGPDLTPSERAFLDHAVARRRAEEHDLAARAAAQRRANRRLRWSLAAVATLLAGATLAALVAVTQRDRAGREEREAALQALVSRSDALRPTRRDLAALLAVEAHRLAPGPDTRSALFGSFTASPGVERIVGLDGERFEIGAILPDGDTVALLDERASVHVVDLASGAQTALLESRRDEEAVSYVALSPDGRYLAVVSFRITSTGEFADVPHDELTIWDLRTGQRRFPDVALPFHAGSVAFSPDGSLVAVGGGGDARIQIHDAATGATRLEIEPLPRPADASLLVSTVAVAFASDGSLIVGSESGPIRIIDPGTGRERRRIDAPPMTAHYLLRLGTDGRSLTTVGLDGVAHYDLVTGEPLWPAPAAAGCNSLAHAERIGVLLCGEWSGRVVAVDLATGAIVGRRFDSHQGTVSDVLVSPDGTTMIEVISSTPVYVQWRLDGGGPVSAPVPDITTAADLAYVRGGDALLVATDGAPDRGGSRANRIIDPDTGEVVDPLTGVIRAVPIGDSARLVAIFADGTLGVYDLDRRAPVGTRVDAGFVPEGISATADRVVAWGGGRLRGIGLGSGALVPPLIEQDAAIEQAVVTDSSHLLTLDGLNRLLHRRDPETGEPLGDPVAGFNLLAARANVVVANTADGQLLVIDPDSLEPIGGPLPPITGPADAMALSDDGRRLAVLGADQMLRLYDVPSRTQLGDEIPVGLEGGAVAVRDDGLEAVVTTDRGLVRWDLNPDHWVEAGCRLAGRNLTGAEWDQYLGDLAAYRRTCPDLARAAIRSHVE